MYSNVLKSIMTDTLHRFSEYISHIMFTFAMKHDKINFKDRSLTVKHIVSRFDAVQDSHSLPKLYVAFSTN